VCIVDLASSVSISAEKIFCVRLVCVCLFFGFCFGERRCFGLCLACFTGGLLGVY